MMMQRLAWVAGNAPYCSGDYFKRPEFDALPVNIM